MECLRCGELLHDWRNCTTTNHSNNTPGIICERKKQENSGTKRKYTKASQAEITANIVTALIDYSKIAAASATTTNSTLVDSGSYKPGVRFSEIFKDSIVDAELFLLYLTGTERRVAVAAREPLGNISSVGHVPTNSIRAIGTSALNQLGFSFEELKLTEWATGKIIFGKLIHELVWITSVQFFDVAYCGGNHVDVELTRVHSSGDNVASVARRQANAYLWLICIWSQRVTVKRKVD